MSLSNPSDEFYKKLTSKLKETTSWPSTYLYKFIVKTDPDKIQKIEHSFNNMEAEIAKTPSKKGTYTSISIQVIMTDPEAVVKKYKQIGASVEGVISL